MNNALVAKNLHKVEGVKLVTGHPAFTADFSLPGMLVGKILPSPHAHARIKRIDASKARSLAGVHAVLTWQDVPRVPHTAAAPTWLLDNKVRFVGDRVAAVAAETRAIAEESCSLIEVEYEVLPPVLRIEDAIKPGAPVIHDELDSIGIHNAARNIACHIFEELGDIKEGFRRADLIFEREYRTHRQQPCPIEPPVAIAWIDPDNRPVIRSGTQVPFREVLLEDITAALALATRRPVKIEYTRAEEFSMARSRHPQILRLRMGVKLDGTIVASEMKVIATTGAYSSHANTFQSNTGGKGLPLYRAPHMLFECDLVYTNTPPAGAFRGSGCPQGFFAQETLVDEIAEELNMDPIEFRKKNLIRLSCGLTECLEQGAKAIGWKAKRKLVNDESNPLKRGVGMAVTMQGGGGADTVVSQIAAETLGVTPDKITITSGDTDFTPFDVASKIQILGTASHCNTDSAPSFCVTFAEVEVDTETGQIKVLNLVSAVNPGKAINPKQAEGQVEGAAAQGMGYALTEEMVLDETGRVINPDFLDYKVFGPQELACLKTILVETDEPHVGPYGAKSISEAPVNGPAPAIANAVFHACGIGLRKLPMRPEDVLIALRTKALSSSGALEELELVHA
jgi:CO/xanthine dehydrogenase Mo-binding subunit